MNRIAYAGAVGLIAAALGIGASLVNATPADAQANSTPNTLVERLSHQQMPPADENEARCVRTIRSLGFVPDYYLDGSVRGTAYVPNGKIMRIVYVPEVPVGKTAANAGTPSDPAVITSRWQRT